MKLGNERVIIPLSGKNMTVEPARSLIGDLGQKAWGFKLHPTKIMRFWAEGYDVIADCKAHNAKVFVDLKGLDIPSEITNMIRDLEEIGVDLITVHCSGGREMLKSAVSERRKAMLCGVTVLTSMKQLTIKAVYNMGRDERILSFARAAFQTGLNGTVSSAADLRLFNQDQEKKRTGQGQMIRITPGIRWPDEAIVGDDQDRVLTPQKARAAGADLLVIGRPIILAKDPVAALERANAEFWS